MFQLFHHASFRPGLEGELSQVRFRAALLQTMRAFRTFYAIPMPEADSGPDSRKRSGERMRVIFTTGHGCPRRGAVVESPQFQQYARTRAAVAERCPRRL